MILVVNMLLVSCEKKGGEAILSSSPTPTVSPTPRPTATPSPTPSVSPTPRPTPTPDCETDSDCDDGDPCTIDYCVDGKCKHEDKCTDKCKPCNPSNGNCEDKDCDDKNDCTTDTCESATGNCKNECKADGAGCNPDVSPSPSPTPESTSTPASISTSSPSPSFSPSPTAKGFCKDCVCEEKDCDSVYGDDYESCGKGPGLNCCFKGKCCHKEHCCKPNEECTSFGFIIYDWYCNPQSCPSHLPVFCQADNKNVCCPAGSICIYHSEGTFQGAECGKTECDANETECPPGGDYFEGGVKCCKESEECKNDPEHGYPLCEANSCEEGYSMCQGKKDKKNDYSWRRRCCKNGVEVCSWDPSGYPLCMPLNPVQSPTPSPS